ncbi:response regulator [Azospirillum sp. SYSU D00513]|uniref:response regulator n=1 Tax=Azospirillum sp. SYSU D00513 TaxID=2812561 RepID=UPI001A95BBBA|nr:response regulator [Azospirillum sp. SYSU D00513]
MYADLCCVPNLSLEKCIEMQPHILVCEPDVLVAMVFQDLLEGEGYRVTAVRSGLQGVGVFEADPAHAVITEAIMSDMSGVDLICSLRAKLPDLSVLIVTGHNLPDIRSFPPGPGSTKVMAKPADFAEIMRIIRDMVPVAPTTAA